MRSGGASAAPGRGALAGVPDPAGWQASGLTAAWLGHATVLLRIGGAWVLTDPALRPRIGVSVGPVTIGPRRITPPALRARDLPPLDLLLLSHAHMDHTDTGTLRRLPRTTPVVVQPGNADLVRRFREVRELEWGSGVRLGGLQVTSVPARHWGARLVHDRHRGYGGYLIESPDATVLFTGDTAYTERLGEIGRGRRIDLAIMPIGAYDPWIDNHASPEQAWAMFRDVGATHILPVHHSTFVLSREPRDEPLARLRAAAGDEAWRIVGSGLGETWRAPPAADRPPGYIAG